jgi:N-acetylneuraminic acid mutarotase
MFGGAGFDGAGTVGYLNDLWEFDPGTGNWTWRGGSSAIPAANSCQLGVYGARGTGTPSNVPGGRTGAVAWVDGTGKFWLFGGAGCDATGTDANLNDLWMFDPGTANWTWIAGNSSQGNSRATTGVYGTLGAGSTANQPGSRNGAVAWTDSSGKLWLFGGYGSSSTITADYLNDLWSFNPATDEWTWVAGSNTDPGNGAAPVYGVRGVSAAANTPGARSYASSWVDGSGDLWLFGGFGNAVGFQGNLNDLWKFDVSSGQWTWMSGNNAPSNATRGDPGVYGSIGIPDSANNPSARNGAAATLDSSGHFLLFAGEGVAADGAIHILNDAWMYDLSINQWSWIGGSSLAPNNAYGFAGVYGTLGVAAQESLPGSRISALIWPSPDGRVWLFGGEGFDSAAVDADLNDLWLFEPPDSAPVPSPNPGAYSSAQQIAMSSSTKDATVFYTTDGSTPTSSSPAYAAPIKLRQSATIQAIAIAPGYTPSAVVKATYTITLQTPTIALTSTASTALATNPVTFTATLTAASGTPTGTVTFMDGTTELGTGNVSGGTATYTTSSLAVGTHTITAVYSGDDGFNAVTSAAVTQTISDFNFAPPSGGTTSATVQPGGTVTYQLTVTPPSGSTTLSAVTFSVAGLPAGATSTFNPSSVPANSGTTNVTLSVTVPAQSAAVPASAPRFPLLLGLALLPLLGLGKARRAGKLLLIVLAFGSAAALTAFTGCGGGSGSSGGGTSQPQTYNLTVTATAGSDSHTTNLTLTVQ